MRIPLPPRLFLRATRLLFPLTAMVGFLMCVNTADAFFPARLVPQPKCDKPKCPPKGHKPPFCPPPPCDTPDKPLCPPGDQIPEIDPGSMAGALGVLLSGALMLTDRRRRK